MSSEVYVRRRHIKAPVEDVFRWHEREGAFERLTPPWESVELLERTGGIDQDGSRVTLQMQMGPIRRRWVSEHRDYREGRQFRDVQIQGPFAHWDHRHIFEPVGDNACVLEDRVEYRLPMGWISHWLARRFVRRKLERMFAYRQTTTAQDVEEIFQRYATREKMMKILVSGASGFIGKAFVPFATTTGHQVVRLSRAEPGERDAWWNPVKREIDASALDGIDGVVHLAGENLGARRWSASKKDRIKSSRVDGTRFLCETLAAASRPPKVLVGASAVGFYGNRGDEILNEESRAGGGFLAEVAREWEEATEPCRRRGIRVVNLRIGVVLSPAGGVLEHLLPVFSSGAGGVVGSGKQYVSWIAMDDLLRVIVRVLEDDSFRGPVNAVAPNPVTNEELTKTLGHVLGRPSLMRIPAFALKLALGEAAEETVLASTRVSPKRLLDADFHFRYPHLETALRHTLGRSLAVERHEANEPV